MCMLYVMPRIVGVLLCGNSHVKDLLALKESIISLLLNEVQP